MWWNRSSIFSSSIIAATTSVYTVHAVYLKVVFGRKAWLARSGISPQGYCESRLVTSACTSSTCTDGFSVLVCGNTSHDLQSDIFYVKPNPKCKVAPTYYINTLETKVTTVTHSQPRTKKNKTKQRTFWRYTVTRMSWNSAAVRGTWTAGKSRSHSLKGCIAGLLADDSDFCSTLSHVSADQVWDEAPISQCNH